MNKMDVVNKLETGEISVNKAIALFKESKGKKIFKRGRFIKINIVGNDKRFKIIIPLIFVTWGFSVVKFCMNFVPGKKRKDERMNKAYKIMKFITIKDINSIVNEIRLCKETGFIEVIEKENTVIIEIV